MLLYLSETRRRIFLHSGEKAIKCKLILKLSNHETTWQQVQTDHSNIKAYY